MRLQYANALKRGHDLRALSEQQLPITHDKAPNRPHVGLLNEADQSDYLRKQP